LQGKFKPTDTIRDLVTFISQNRLDGDTPFIISTNVPKRKFEDKDINVSLQEAELVPRGMVIISYR